MPSKHMKSATKVATKTSVKKSPMTVKSTVGKAVVTKPVVAKSPVKKGVVAKTPVKKSVVKKSVVKKTPVKKSVVAEGDDGEDGVVVKKKVRTFKVLVDGVFRQRYTGRNPKQAASKAFTALVRESKRTNGKLPSGFTVRESTKGSKKKIFRYIGERIAVVGQSYTIHKENGETIVINPKFKNRLTSDRSPIVV